MSRAVRIRRLSVRPARPAAPVRWRDGLPWLLLAFVFVVAAVGLFGGGY